MESNKESNEEPNEKTNEELKKPVNRKPLIITAAIAAAVCVAAAAVIFAEGSNTEKRLTEQLDLAKRCLSELDYGSAITAYEAAIVINPKAEDAYIGLANAYIGLGDYEAAIDALVRGIAESDSEMLTEYLAEVNAEYSQRERMRLAEEAAIVKEAEANEYYETGRAYLYGLDGREINLESAYTNFERALEMGKTEANFYLGLLCDWYGYPEQDYEMARAYYEKCEDDPYAQLTLGCLYYYGNGVEEDKERGKELFQSVISQGCVEGYLGTAWFLEDEEEYEAALENYTKVLEGTEQIFIADAMNMIGWMYKNGHGVEQDYAVAMEWYKKAAALGNANAMNNIGWAYCHGIGAEQDYAAALAWYEKAIDLGNVSAMNNMGYMYQYGEGVESNYAVALEWYEKAAALGNTNAMHNAGCMYFYGDGVERDYAAALAWFEKAAELGNESAMGWVEYMYKYRYAVE